MPGRYDIAHRLTSVPEYILFRFVRPTSNRRYGRLRVIIGFCIEGGALIPRRSTLSTRAPDALSTSVIVLSTRRKACSAKMRVGLARQYREMQTVNDVRLVLGGAHILVVGDHVVDCHE